MIGYGARIEERCMMNNFEKELTKIVEERVDKYGLETIFSNIYDVEHSIIEAFNSGRDEWFSEVIDALDYYLPVY